MGINARQQVITATRAMLDLILPPRCRICNRSTVGEGIPWVCQTCWLAVAYIKPPICYQCGQPFAAPPEGIALSTHRCGVCRLTPPPYSKARAVGFYRGTLREMIHAMKYQPIYGLVRPLADLLCSQFNVHWGDRMPDLLIPVPLHRRRRRQREFDQALALARHVSQQINIPLTDDLLIRHRHTASQVGLNAAQRRRNVRQAFQLKGAQACQGRSLLLIDDVYTTGATIGECARLLQQAGADWVGVYTLARVG
jgi:ComF family protein